MFEPVQWLKRAGRPVFAAAAATVLAVPTLSSAATIPFGFESITEVAEPFIGVTQYRIVQPFDEPLIALPRPLVINLVEIDPTASGVSFTTTPPNGDAPGQYTRQTTSSFVDNVGVSVGINGDFFTTEEGGAPIPDLGANVIGLAMHEGTVVAPPNAAHDNSLILRGDQTGFIFDGDTVPADAFNAISGNQRIVTGGIETAPEDVFTATANPRTAVGVDSDTGNIWFAVVDGRQENFSEGLRTDELGDLLIAWGVDDAINLDGGGSSALVFADGPGGAARTVNSPSDGSTPQTPGNERAVANHLGVLAMPNPDYVPLTDPTRPPEDFDRPDFPQSPFTVFTEETDGDLSNSNASPNVIDLQVGLNSIIGEVGGGDSRDVFSFTLEEGEELVSIKLVAYNSDVPETDATPLQAASGDEFPANGIPDIGQSVLSDANEGTEVLPMAGSFTYGPGTYSFRTTEFGSAAVYQLDFQVIPEPTSIALVGFGALALLRRRRAIG